MQLLWDQKFFDSNMQQPSSSVYVQMTLWSNHKPPWSNDQSRILAQWTQPPSPEPLHKHTLHQGPAVSAVSISFLKAER
ncbi:hypothetical protein EYF80_009575 [Liparis tanakae]|uniref:Uncharacterized protein n=1 Tax=Liparis tanakae TaxID=230148 RepID=A0A4Z2IQI0_9TELE|nr:hypothetical protein EYF80_009575 [Liparis tanakae]